MVVPSLVLGQKGVEDEEEFTALDSGVKRENCAVSKNRFPVLQMPSGP